jgi:hypothetical protein
MNVMLSNAQHSVEITHVSYPPENMQIWFWFGRYGALNSRKTHQGAGRCVPIACHASAAVPGFWMAQAPIQGSV